MAPEVPSNIRVFIRWHDQTVFAGEEVKCTITFKNVAPVPGQSKPPPQQSERSRLASPLHTRPRSNQGLTPPPSASSGRGHRRSALSLSAIAVRATLTNVPFPLSQSDRTILWKTIHNAMIFQRDLKDRIAVMGALRVYRYFLECKANFRLDLILVDYFCPLPSLLANQRQPLSPPTVFRAHHYSTLHILRLTDLAEYLVRRQILNPL
ncbi:hypothetical protein ACHAPD_001843 [Fusarium lateritium]